MIRRDAMQIRPHRYALRTLAVAGLFCAGVAFAGNPQVELGADDLGDPVIAARLRAAYQLPTWLEGASQAGAEVTPLLLDAAIQRERMRLQQLMADLGYLDAKVRLDRAGGKMVFRPSLGRLFAVSAIELKGVDQFRLGRSVVAALSSIIADYVSGPATAEAAESMGRRILYTVGQEDFATATLRQVRFVSTGKGEAVAAVDLDTGPRMHFGKVTFSGLRRLRQPDLARLIPFAAGERYERSRVEALRTSLETLDRVDGVHISTGPSASDPAAVDIAVRIHETSVEPAALRQGEGLGMGLAAMAGLALLQLVPKTGIQRRYRRLLLLAVSVTTVAFAGFLVMRVISFLS